MIERGETLQIMDQLEALILKKGWPVPCTPYYLVNHEKLLHLMDQLRVSLQDEMDGRFIKAFAQDNHHEKKLKPKVKGKERSH